MGIDFLPHQKNQYLPILRKKFVFVKVRETLNSHKAIKKPDQVGVAYVDARTWGYSLELMALAILADFIGVSTWEQGIFGQQTKRVAMPAQDQSLLGV